MTPHCRDHFIADYEGSDIGALSFLDEVLYQEVGVQLPERRDDRLGRFPGLREHDSQPLSPFEELHHDGRASYHFEDTGNILGAVGEAGRWQTNAGAGQDLKGAELVSRSTDAVRAVGGVDIGHLELPDDCRPVEGVGGTDAGDNRMGTDFLSPEHDLRSSGGDVHVATQIVDYRHFMASICGGLFQSSGRVQAGTSREDRYFHVASIFVGRRPM